MIFAAAGVQAHCAVKEPADVLQNAVHSLLLVHHQNTRLWPLLDVQRSRQPLLRCVLTQRLRSLRRPQPIMNAGALPACSKC